MKPSLLPVFIRAIRHECEGVASHELEALDHSLSPSAHLALDL